MSATCEPVPDVAKAEGINLDTSIGAALVGLVCATTYAFFYDCSLLYPSSEKILKYITIRRLYGTTLVQCFNYFVYSHQDVKYMKSIVS